MYNSQHCERVISILSLEIIRFGSEKLGHYPKDTQLINSHQNLGLGQLRSNPVFLLIKDAPHLALGLLKFIEFYTHRPYCLHFKTENYINTE